MRGPVARGRLAGYKVPRTIVFGAVPRAANGSLLYTEARRVLEEHLTRSSTASPDGA